MKKNLFYAVLLVLGSLCHSAQAGWEPLAELKAPDPCESAWFGFSVSINNGTAVIGAPWRNSDQGAVYVYDFNEPNNWDYVTTLLPPELSDTDRFGYSVCIDSNKIVVGTYYAEEVYVFDYNGTEWSDNPEILSVAGSQDYFGTDVSIDSNTIVVGARGSASQTGAAYVFDYNVASWDYKQTLTDSSGANGDQFGYSVAVDGNVIVVGARWDTVVSYREGSVLVFRLSGGTWSFEQKIENSGGDNADGMGRSVAVSGDTFVAGVYSYAYGANGDAGAAFVYKWNGASWVKETTLYDPNTDTSSRFGNSVAIDGNSIVVGEMYYDGNASDSGAAFLFERNGGSWSEGQKLEDPSGAASDYFGRSVAIDGETIIAGAYKDDGGATDSGAAFIFLIFIADLSQDGIVNFKDFAILADYWRVSGLGPYGGADLTGDGIVDTADLKVFVSYWLKNCDEFPIVITQEVLGCSPEPQTSQETFSSEELRFNVTVQGDYIYFEDMIYANCCFDDFLLEMEIDGNEITIYEIAQIQEYCRCMCDFPATAMLGPFADGEYLFEVIDIDGSSLGTVPITIEGL